MFTFLPPEFAEAVRKEYGARVRSVSFGLLSVAFALAAAGLLPAATSLWARANSAVAPVATEEAAALEARLEDIKAKTRALSASADQRSMLVSLEKVLSKKGEGIRVTALSLRRGAETGAITVTGVADTRERLVAFSKELQGESTFSQVVLPIASLTRAKDVSFTITIDTAL